MIRQSLIALILACGCSSSNEKELAVSIDDFRGRLERLDKLLASMQ